MNENTRLNLISFVETPRKFTIAELSIRKLGSSSVLHQRFHKANQVYCIHHANVQETCTRLCYTKVPI